MAAASGFATFTDLNDYFKAAAALEVVERFKLFGLLEARQRGQFTEINIGKGKGVEFHLTWDEENGGAGFKSAAATIHKAAPMDAKVLQAPYAFYSTRVEIGQFAEKLSVNDPNVASILLREGKAHTRRFGRRLSMYGYLNGDGVLATVTASSTGTTIPVDSTQYLRANMVIKVATDKTTISSVDSTTQITVADSITYADGDGIYLLDGDDAVVDTGEVPAGLSNIIDDTDALILGSNSYSRSTYPHLKAFVDSAAADREPTLDLFRQFVADLAESSGEVPDFIVTHPYVATRLESNLTEKMQVMLTDLTGSVAYGIDSAVVKYEGKKIPIISDRFCPRKTAFAINKEYMRLCIGIPPQLSEPIESEEHNIWTSKFIAALAFGATRFDVHGKMTQLAENNAARVLDLK